MSGRKRKSAAVDTDDGPIGSSETLKTVLYGLVCNKELFTVDEDQLGEHLGISRGKNAKSKLKKAIDDTGMFWYDIKKGKVFLVDDDHPKPAKKQRAKKEKSEGKDEDEKASGEGESAEKEQKSTDKENSGASEQQNEDK